MISCSISTYFLIKKKSPCMGYMMVMFSFTGNSQANDTLNAHL